MITQQVENVLSHREVIGIVGLLALVVFSTTARTWGRSGTLIVVLLTLEAARSSLLFGAQVIAALDRARS